MLIGGLSVERPGHLGEPGRRAGIVDDKECGHRQPGDDQDHAFSQEEIGVDVVGVYQAPEAFAQRIEANDRRKKGDGRGEDDKRFGAQPAIALREHRAPFRRFD